MKKRDWYVEHRQRWIMEMLDIYGFINRNHLMKKFGVSTAQAALDFRDLQDRYPDAMIYNESAKRYEKLERDVEDGPQESQEVQDHYVRLRRRRASRRNRRVAQ